VGEVGGKFVPKNLLKNEPIFKNLIESN